MCQARHGPLYGIIYDVARARSLKFHKLQGRKMGRGRRHIQRETKTERGKRGGACRHVQAALESENYS